MVITPELELQENLANLMLLRRIRWQSWLKTSTTNIWIKKYTKTISKLERYKRALNSPQLLWRGGKKNAPAQGHMTYRLKEQKPSKFKQNILLIEGFKYDLLPCIFAKKVQFGSWSASLPIFKCCNPLIIIRR